MTRPRPTPILALLALVSTSASAQKVPPKVTPPVLLRPARVFDGVDAAPHSGWAVLVREGAIAAVGPAAEVQVPEGARTLDLPGSTLMPGLIDVPFSHFAPSLQ